MVWKWWMFCPNVLKRFRRTHLRLIYEERGQIAVMGLLPDRQNCGLRMRRECRERFPRHRLQRKQLVNDPGMRHGTCITHVSWSMSGSLTRGGRENVPGIPGTCATRNFTYLARGPFITYFMLPYTYMFGNDLDMYLSINTFVARLLKIWNKNLHNSATLHHVSIKLWLSLPSIMYQTWSHGEALVR